MADRTTSGTSTFDEYVFTVEDDKQDYEDSGSDAYETDGLDNDIDLDDANLQPNKFTSDGSVSQDNGALNFAPPDYGPAVERSDVPVKPDLALAMNQEFGKESQIKSIFAFAETGTRPSILGEATSSLQAADQLRKEGKTTEAQAKYEEALKKVKDTDMATITTQWQSQLKQYNVAAEKLNALGNPPSNPQEAKRLAAELQQLQDTGSQLKQTIQDGNKVKVGYAGFLNEQGKSGEAFILLSGVAAQTPSELLAEDETFAEQMERAQHIGSITSGEAEKQRLLYEQTGAEEHLAALKEESQKSFDSYLQSLKDRVTLMSKRQTEIDSELAQLQKNSEMNQDAKALRQLQLANEKKGYDVVGKAIEDSFERAEKAHEKLNSQFQWVKEHMRGLMDEARFQREIRKAEEALERAKAAEEAYRVGDREKAHELYKRLMQNRK